MRRKNFFLSIICALLILGLAGSLVWALLQHEPGFYRRGQVSAGPERKNLSTAFMGNFLKLYNQIIDGKGEWEINFSEAQINSYFQEDFIRLRDATVLQGYGITDPRVAIVGDRLRLGFRYGHEPFSTIVSFNLRLWLASKDINVMAVEIESRHGGGLPLPSQSILEKIAELARWQNLDLTWYRHDNHPVALIRFQADRPRPSALLRRLEIHNGLLNIGGLSLEPLQQ